MQNYKFCRQEINSAGNLPIVPAPITAKISFSVKVCDEITYSATYFQSSESINSALPLHAAANCADPTFPVSHHAAKTGTIKTLSAPECWA